MQNISKIGESADHINDFVSQARKDVVRLMEIPAVRSGGMAQSYYNGAVMLKADAELSRLGGQPCYFSAIFHAARVIPNFEAVRGDALEVVELSTKDRGEYYANELVFVRVIQVHRLYG
jgi:hypothetical protein